MSVIVADSIMEERKSEPHSEHRKSELPSEHRKSEQSLEGRKSRSSTFKEQVRQNTQIEFRRPEFFEDEYLALDLDAKRIHKKMKSRDKAADKGFVINNDISECNFRGAVSSRQVFPKAEKLHSKLSPKHFFTKSTSQNLFGPHLLKIDLDANIDPKATKLYMVI